MIALRSHPNPFLQSFGLTDSVQKPSMYYRAMRRICYMLTALWKVRVFNRHLEPADGSAVYICNHQSFFDPILMGMALRRPMNYMARDTLFRIPGLKQLIASLNTFPVRRGTADTGALKEAMRRLRAGHQVMVFAEGTRTRDGRVGRFLPGVAMLAQRAAKWIVPVVIDGAFEAWPRTQALPGGGNIVVQYAPPIPRAEAGKLNGEQLIRRVRQAIIEMQTDIRRRVGRPALNYSNEHHSATGDSPPHP